MVNQPHDFLDIPTAWRGQNEVQDLPLHHPHCSSRSGMICDCIGLRLAYWAWEESSKQWGRYVEGLRDQLRELSELADSLDGRADEFSEPVAQVNREAATAIRQIVRGE